MVERGHCLLVAHDQPGVMTIGQPHAMHCAELADLREEGKGVVDIEGTP
jgi:hypothetical protein